jgi:DNA-binding CsgD family transcriptional regulator/tetratricopeptide (TPR) repeat protein
VLVEREVFVAALAALLDEAAGGSGRLVFLGGEAGVGKTTLITALAEGAADQLIVRRGGCDNVATPAPLGPLVDAVPELADALEGGTAVNRLRLFRQVRAVLSTEPTLLLLEDLHWADESTLELVRFLGRRLDGMPILVIATFREDEVAASHPLTVVLGDLATLPGVARMQLPPLTVSGVGQLLAGIGSSLDAEQLHRNTGGNPFYLTELLAAGSERLPATVRDAVLARASRLSPDARQVLAAAAVLGQRADLQLLSAVSGQLPAAVDECVHRGVLVSAGGLLAFRHELARLAIEETLAPAVRTDLHAAALDALRSAGRDDRTLAYHAAGCGNGDAVLEHAPRAGERAARLGAHREAAELYRLTLRFHDRPDARRAQLFAALSYECYLTDQLEEAHSARREAMDLAEQAGDTVAVGVAQRWLSRLSWFVGRNDESERYAALAVATLQSVEADYELAMAYSNLAQLRMLANDIDEAVSWGRRAIELARESGNREAEIHALNNVGTALLIREDVVEGPQRLAQSLDMALSDNAHEHVARAYTNLGSINVNSRRLSEADQHLRAGIAYCADRDLDSWRLYMTAWLARSLAEQGRHAASEQCTTDVLRHQQLSPVTRMVATVVAGQLAARHGEDATKLLDEAMAVAAPTGEAQRAVPVAAARAEAAWLAGNTSEIVVEIDRAWPALIAHPQRWDLGELSWWLAVAGVRRESPMTLAPPFALMLGGAWREAAAAWQVLGCPLWAAHALAASPDLADAREALEIVDTIGAPAVRAAMLRDRHRQGLPVPRGPRPGSQANPSGLTARELEVLGLLADGLSNAEVAERLFLSQKTVGHHVSSVLHKLGEPSRSHAVAAALREGILAPR